jgi:hypothetical protein
MREDDFERDMDALEETIFHLVDFPHSATIDKANDDESAGDCLSGLEAANRARSSITEVPMTARCFHRGHGEVRRIRERARHSPREAAGLRVCKQQFFHPLPQFRRTCTGAVKKIAAILRAQLQSGTEQLLNGLFLATHHSHPEE